MGMRKRKDNRGSAMVLVIVVIAFVSVLIATLFMMSTINIQMKSVDRKAKENFYSAEGALEQINLGLQNEISEASAIAYTQVMQNYANSALEVERRQRFNAIFLSELKDRIGQSGSNDKYDENNLATYLSDDVRIHTVLSSTKDYRLNQENDSLVLKGLVVTYTDDQQYQSIIETDIRLSAPNLNLIQPSDMPDIFEYSIIANEKLLGNGSGNVTISANVYAGENGLLLDNGANWRFDQAKRVVVRGKVQIPKTAAMTAVTDMDLWAQELVVEGGTLYAKGRTYVANDLVMSNTGSNVTLEGEYYGYGNAERLTDSGLSLPYGGDSSAILINGTQTTLDMTSLRKLLLSGSAQIATGDVQFDREEIEGELPENEPSLETKLRSAVLSAGAYSIQSVGNGLLACSEGNYQNYLVARSGAGEGTAGEGSWERFLLVNNSDGTFSLMDYNKKYVSVQTDDSFALKAVSDEIGANEKFYLYSLEGKPGQYAMKSYANGKYVSIDTYYKEDGDTLNATLCANRDKVTDSNQLFIISRVGDLPVTVEEQDPVMTFTYSNSSTVHITFADPDWGTDGAPGGYGVWISYTVNDTADIKNDVAMEFPANRRHAFTDISTLWDGAVVKYTIRYTTSTGEKQYSGTYTQNPGLGNNGTGEGGFVNGIYSWRLGVENSTEKVYAQTTEWSNGQIKFSAGNVGDADYAWEKFAIVNNDDGTVSLMTRIDPSYISIQDDGSLWATGENIGINEKFRLIFIAKDGGYYRLQTLEGSKGNGKYVCANLNMNNYPAYLVNGDDIQGWEDHFYFDWLEYTTEKGESTPVVVPVTPNYNPVTNMKYETEQSAKATFTTPYWDGSDGEGVTIHYEINGGATTSATMDKSGVNASYIVPGLRDQDKVTYRFTYTYREAGGTLKTATTATSIYIHETQYGSAVNIQGENKDVNLGESLEVKSNQIAYLVPAECIGVNGGETIIGKNPMSASDFTRMMSYADNEERYPDFEIVSFTKEVESLGRSLDEYRTAGTDGYKVVFQQTSDGTLVYFYVDFDSDNSSKYFRDYYAQNQSTLDQYMQSYVSEIRLSSRFTRLTTDGNMVYGTGGGNGSLYLRSNEGYGAYLTSTERSGQKNEETGYQKRFQALYRKLILDYGDLTQTEKVRDVFENLIRYSEEAGGDATSHAFAGISSTGITYSAAWEGGSSITALVVNNKDSGAYHYNSGSDPRREICLIIATGDVVLEQDFSGLVIAKGTVTVANASVNVITGNREKLYKILQTRLDPDDENSETIIEHYFRDGDRYVLDSSLLGEIVGDAAYISYSDLVTYEEWTKR